MSALTDATGNTGGGCGASDADVGVGGNVTCAVGGGLRVPVGEFGGGAGGAGGSVNVTFKSAANALKDAISSEMMSISSSREVEYAQTTTTIMYYEQAAQNDMQYNISDSHISGLDVSQKMQLALPREGKTQYGIFMMLM